MHSAELVIIIWYSATPSRIIVFIKNLTTIKKKSRKNGKNEKRNLNGTRIAHMTERKRRQNLAKCCSVSLQSWMNQWKLLESEQSSTRFGKKSSNYWLWNMVHVWFFLKHCCNHRSKRIEAVQFHHISCWSWNWTSL